jgi:hypothetical protein
MNLPGGIVLERRPESGPSHEPSKQESAALQQLKTMRDQCKKARQPYDAEAWLNMAFMFNEQYTEWSNDDFSAAGGHIRRIPRGKDEEDVPRPVFNKIQHYIYTAHSETLQDKPSMDVLPANDDYTASMDADVNKAYLNYVMEPVNANWDLQLSDATLWALIAPSGWLKWVWDPAFKRPDILPVSYFEVYVDPYAKQWQRARYCFHSMFMDADQVEDNFGVKLEPADIGITDELRVGLLKSMGSTPIAQGVQIHEFWMRPNRRHPKGMYAIFTDRHLLKIQDSLPYEYLALGGGMLPFTQLGSLRRPDSLYYTSPVTALRPAQQVWNKFVAQAIMTQEHWANLKWWIPEELQLQHQPDSSPHQILTGNSQGGTLKPEILVPSGTPDVTRLLDVFEQQMMHVVSVHEVSQGQVPGRVEAAKAIELLKSADEGRYKHLLDTIDAAISQGGWQVLMAAREFETPRKQVLTFSREGMPQVKHWRASAVHPGTQVRVVRMSGLGRTRAQRQDSLLLLWDKQIIKDPDVMAELMDVPIPSFTNVRARDMRMARSENIEMSQGIPVEPHTWENNAIHLREHNEFRKTQEYRMLNARAKAIFEWHCGLHEKYQISEARKMAMLQAAMMPPAPGPGIPPVGQGEPASPPSAETPIGVEAAPETGAPNGTPPQT